MFHIPVSPFGNWFLNIHSHLLFILSEQEFDEKERTGRFFGFFLVDVKSSYGLMAVIKSNASHKNWRQIEVEKIWIQSHIAYTKAYVYAN